MLTIGGDNSIINKAKQAVEEHNLVSAREKVMLEVNNIKLKGISEGTNLKGYLFGGTNEQQQQRANELSAKGIEVSQLGDQIKFMVDGKYEVITNENGTVQSVEKTIQIAVSNIAITTEGTTVPEDGTLSNGTPVIIDFDVSVEGGENIIVTPTLPYTTDGIEKNKTFTIEGTVNGKAFRKTEVISVDSKYVALGEATQISVAGIQVGDFINYKAGTWTAQEIADLTDKGLYTPNGELPTNNSETGHYKFGGFKEGDSKDNSILRPYINPNYNRYSNNYAKGWIVIQTSPTIKIMHAGTPEGYFHPNIANGKCAYKSEYILNKDSIGNTNGADVWGNYSTINKRDWSVYENEYAEGGTAHCMTYSEANTITKTLRTKGSYYWLSSAHDSNYLDYVFFDGYFAFTNNDCLGVVPVVSLKSNIKVAGYQGDSTHATLQTAWEIVE